jgi:hypothetical protein
MILHLVARKTVFALLFYTNLSEDLL